MYIHTYNGTAMDFFARPEVSALTPISRICYVLLCVGVRLQEILIPPTNINWVVVVRVLYHHQVMRLYYSTVHALLYPGRSVWLVRCPNGLAGRYKFSLAVLYSKVRRFPS